MVKDLTKHREVIRGCLALIKNKQSPNTLQTNIDLMRNRLMQKNYPAYSGLINHCNQLFSALFMMDNETADSHRKEMVYALESFLESTQY